MQRTWPTARIERVAEALRSAKQDSCPAALLLGAGLSASAGIPTARGMITAIREKYPAAYADCPKKDSYAAVMAQLELRERRALIKGFIDEAKMNWGHIAVALIMRAGFVDRVLTTNFDPLLSRACALIGLFPAVYDLAVAKEYDLSALEGQAIFHLHGQHTGFSILNTDEEVTEISGRMQPVFADTGTRRSWIVCGYSGACDPVAERLIELTKFSGGLYWVGFENREPDQALQKNLLTPGGGAKWVSGFRADDFFVRLAQELKCFPPDFIQQPFDHLLHLLEKVMEWQPPDGFTGERHLKLMEQARERIRAAGIAAPTAPAEGAPAGATAPETAAQSEIPVPLLTKETALYLLLRGQVQELIELAGPDPTAVPEEVRKLVASAAFSRAVTLRRSGQQANGPGAAPDPEIARLYRLTVTFDPSHCEALNNWGNALTDEARATAGDGEIPLFRQAGTKYAAALAIKPDLHEALHNWGVALETEAWVTAGDGKIPLFHQAGEKYAAALAIKPDKHEALLGMGNALAGEAGATVGDEQIPLFRQAGEKYAAALAIKPDNHEALTNWGLALADEAHATAGDGKIPLFRQAGKKYAAALAIRSDDHKALTGWGLALDEEGRATAGDGKIPLFRQAGEKYAAALAINPDNHEALTNWGNALLEWAGVDPLQAEALRAEAEEKLNRAEEIAPGSGAYGFACIAALRGQPDQARHFLETARDRGTLPSRAHLDSDSDMDTLRTLPWFIALRDAAA
jgi:tetratricopeptide (TPR) repeat protein